MNEVLYNSVFLMKYYTGLSTSRSIILICVLHTELQIDHKYFEKFFNGLSTITKIVCRFAYVIKFYAGLCTIKLRNTDHVLQSALTLFRVLDTV